MKPVRSAETLKMRRELAQLLRRLRAIGRAKLPHEEVAATMLSAVREARSLGRFMTFPHVGCGLAVDGLAQMDSAPRAGVHALGAAEPGK